MSLHLDSNITHIIDTYDLRLKNVHVGLIGLQCKSLFKGPSEGGGGVIKTGIKPFCVMVCLTPPLLNPSLLP